MYESYLNGSGIALTCGKFLLMNCNPNPCNVFMSILSFPLVFFFNSFTISVLNAVNRILSFVPIKSKHLIRVVVLPLPAQASTTKCPCPCSINENIFF